MHILFLNRLSLSIAACLLALLLIQTSCSGEEAQEQDQLIPANQAWVKKKMESIGAIVKNRVPDSSNACGEWNVPDLGKPDFSSLMVLSAKQSEWLTTMSAAGGSPLIGMDPDRRNPLLMLVKTIYLDQSRYGFSITPGEVTARFKKLEYIGLLQQEHYSRFEFLGDSENRITQRNQRKTFSVFQPATYEARLYIYRISDQSCMGSIAVSGTNSDELNFKYSTLQNSVSVPPGRDPAVILQLATDLEKNVLQNIRDALHSSFSGNALANETIPYIQNYGAQ